MATTNINDSFNVSIVEASRELTRREKLKYSDNGNAVKINSVVTTDTPLVITPVMYVITETHNERAKSNQNKNYTSLCIEDSSGERYYSGSESLMSSFLNIWNTMVDDNGNPAEEYQIEIRQIPSSNREGQSFLKAFIV